jgi:hypothetical protein
VADMFWMILRLLLLFYNRDCDIRNYYKDLKLHQYLSYQIRVVSCWTANAHWWITNY